MKTVVLADGKGEFVTDPNATSGGIRAFDFQLGRDTNPGGRLATLSATGDPTTATCEVSDQATTQGG